MSSSQQELTINDGPSKFEIMVALFERRSRDGLPVTLCTGDSERTSRTFWAATVNSCAAQIAPHGETWRLRGLISEGAGSIKSSARIYEAVFDTSKRRGVITIFPEGYGIR